MALSVPQAAFQLPVSSLSSLKKRIVFSLSSVLGLCLSLSSRSVPRTGLAVSEVLLDGVKCTPFKCLQK